MDMDMSSTMAMDMGSSTTSITMPASATGDSMSSMDDMATSSMEMLFFTSTGTPLWTSSFTPNNTGQYAGVCIFLLAFATIFRLLVAVRINLFRILAGLARRQQGAALLSAYNVEATKDGASENHHREVERPWRASDTIMTAFLDVVIAGVSYLL